MNELEDRLTALLHERAAAVRVVDDLSAIHEERPLASVVPLATAQRRSPRPWGIAAAAVLVVAGVGLTALARRGSDPLVGEASTEPAPAPSTIAPQTSAPETLEVRCDGTTTTILTPTVQAQRDGVHALVHNVSGGPLSIEWGNGGDGAPRRDSQHVLPVPPGTARFRCTTDVAAEADGWVSFTVLEAPGWISPDLDCPTQGTGIFDFVPGAVGVDDPLADAVRYARARSSADDIEVVPAGYVTADERSFLVFEDGSPTMLLTYSSDGQGGWLLSSPTTCS